MCSAGGGSAMLSASLTLSLNSDKIKDAVVTAAFFCHKVLVEPPVHLSATSKTDSFNVHVSCITITDPQITFYHDI